jgi:DMSO/TMAO reductase YedYZ molybdopterin-dependent catalytic subunit
VGLARVRAGRGTNLALLVLVALAVLTGALAFALGSGWAWWAIAAHGVVASAIVLLAPWKGSISARGLKRQRSGSVASLALAGLVVVAVATGVAHAVGWWTTGLAMQVHVGSALATIPLLIWHVVARPVRPRRTDLSRRALLRSTALAGGAIAAVGVVEVAVRVTGARGADRRFTGSYERGSHDPDAMPIIQWLDDDVQAIDPASYALTLVGPSGVGEVAFERLDSAGDEVTATLDCTGGWFAEQRWSGIRLDRLITDVGDARSLLVAGSTGYARRFPLEDPGSLLLATRAEGEPLSAGHGAPVRLVAPGRRGFWWVKWVDRVELDGRPWWWQSPFPLT